ncbi:MAG: substrate-binding domain-containing protein [Mediterraneibacter gnavus]
MNVIKDIKKQFPNSTLTEICPESTEQANTFEYGFQCAESLLTNYFHLDAIITSVDIQGIGALRAIKEQSMIVPEDIRLVSLTGHSIGSMLETTMTSLEIPAHEMGKKSALMAIEEIDAPSDQKPSPQHLVFEATLVERESS